MMTVKEVSNLTGVSIRTCNITIKSVCCIRRIERRRGIACMMMLHWNDCNRSCCSENWNFHWRISEKF